MMAAPMTTSMLYSLVTCAQRVAMYLCANPKAWGHANRSHNMTNTNGPKF